jgi:hypothetical protein
MKKTEEINPGDPDPVPSYRETLWATFWIMVIAAAIGVLIWLDSLDPKPGHRYRVGREANMIGDTMYIVERSGLFFFGYSDWFKPYDNNGYAESVGARSRNRATVEDYVRKYNQEDSLYQLQIFHKIE